MSARSCFSPSTLTHKLSVGAQKVDFTISKYF